MAGLLAPVVDEEQLLEIGLLDLEGRDAEPGGSLDQAVGATGQPTPQHVALDPDLTDVGHAAEGVSGDRRIELDLHSADRPAPEGLDRLDRHELAVTDDPDPVCTLLDLAQDMRRHEDGLAGRARLGDELEEPLLDDGIEAAGRLVEDQELGLVHERLHHPDLLAIAL